MIWKIKNAMKSVIISERHYQECQFKAQLYFVLLLVYRSFYSAQIAAVCCLFNGNWQKLDVQMVKK